MRFAALFVLISGFGALSRALDLTTIDAFREKFYAHEEQLWKNVTDQKWNEMSEVGADVELTKAFKRLDEELSSVGPVRRPPIAGSVLWPHVVKKLQIVEGVYKEFAEFSRRQATPGSVPAPVKDWLDLAEHVLMDPTSSVAQAVRKLDDLLLHGDLFRSVLQDEHPDLCNLQLSPHQLIYDLYNTISLTEIKGYAMMQFSWMLLRIYGKGNFTQEASLTRMRYGQRAAKTAKAARHAMEMAKRDVYRCDPVQHIKGETYDEITQLMQGYIENEVDLNPEHTCKENCVYYSYTEKHGCYKDVCRWQTNQCKGRILNCQYIDSDMTICPSSMSNTNRRYDWIEYENGRKLGSVGTCQRPTTKVDSWWKWNLIHCSYCFCLCEDDPRDSERFFSMLEALSDISKNKVVTGLRLKKEGRVFHLQVNEGTLGPRGSVTPEGWVPIQAFDPTDLGKVQGRDYHMLTFEKRAIDMDELDSPKGHILTGVRFQMIGAHLHFEIRSTPFNYTTGRLYPERSSWISNDNTEGTDRPRSQLKLFRPDLPTRSHIPLTVDSKHDQYLEFENSDFDADAAQSTLPYIDIQVVLPLDGKGLSSGAGIIHRGARGSGGFVAVKLLTYDYSRHVHSDPPSEFHDMVPDTTADFLPIVN